MAVNPFSSLFASGSSQTTSTTSAVVANSTVTTQLNVKSFGAFGDGRSHQITSTQLAQRGWTNKYQVGEEWDTIAWREATAAAKAGMTITVPSGTYLVSGQLPLKSDVNWKATGATWKSKTTSAIVLDYTSELHNVTMTGFTFSNLVFQFRGATQASISDLQFKSCTFSGAKNPADPDAVQFYLIRTSNVTFDGCTFSRAKTDIGRGLTIYQSHQVKVLNSKWTGYYATAIVVSGSSYDAATGTFPDATRSVGITISGNTITRTVGTYLEDHGIYATSMRDIKIENNSISGWSSTASGGAVKIRNGEDIVIRNNRFTRSGILAYTYKEDGSVPEYFKNVLIEGNTIKFEYDGRSTTNHTGIFYWRNFGSINDPIEQNIIIRNNVITSGVLDIESAYIPAFTITGNTASNYIVNPQKTDLRKTNTVR